MLAIGLGQHAVGVIAQVIDAALAARRQDVFVFLARLLTAPPGRMGKRRELHTCHAGLLVASVAIRRGGRARVNVPGVAVGHKLRAEVLVRDIEQHGVRVEGHRPAEVGRLGIADPHPGADQVGVAHVGATVDDGDLDALPLVALGPGALGAMPDTDVIPVFGLEPLRHLLGSGPALVHRPQSLDPLAAFSHRSNRPSVRVNVGRDRRQRVVQHFHSLHAGQRRQLHQLVGAHLGQVNLLAQQPRAGEEGAVRYP